MPAGRPLDSTLTPFHGRSAKVRMSLQQILTRIQKQVLKTFKFKTVGKKLVKFSVLTLRHRKRNTKIFDCKVRFRLVLSS